MRSPRRLFTSLVALTVLGGAAIARADSTPTFALGETHTPTTFSTGTGVAQTVDVNSETNVSSFGFFLGQKGGGDANFFIYDVTTSTLTLAPEAVVVNNITTDGKAWAYLDGLSIDLQAGDVYDFGVYGDALLTVGLDPTSSSFAGALTIPTSGPTSYNVTGDTIGSALSGTINAQGLSTADVGLRIYDPPAPAPEPSSLILLGTGILVAAGTMRRRMAAR